MDLPECPPGAEGYEDSVTQVPIKPNLEECTKAEREFQEHLTGLKIPVENGGSRPMVERRGRDGSGKWTYLCFPCAATCSGENVLQTHISGKKHEAKLSSKKVWPQSIFDDHPFEKSKNEDTAGSSKSAPEKLKLADEIDRYNKANEELEGRYGHYRQEKCTIESNLDTIRSPLIGVEYLVEFPPEEERYQPTFLCTLCMKQGYPQTIGTHFTSSHHRYNYLARHYQKATFLLAPYRARVPHRNGVNFVVNRIAQRIEDKYGRLKPVVIPKDDYERDKAEILMWLDRSFHFSEKNGDTFEEIVDPDLITSLEKNPEEPQKSNRSDGRDKNNPSFNKFSRPPGRNERRAPSVESLSDISGDEAKGPNSFKGTRYRPYDKEDPARGSTFRSRFAIRNVPDKQKAPNYDHKVNLASRQKAEVIESANKTLAYHEKNPEKHPLYPDEWKKFWNKRYKEVQAEGKDPSKYDYKPEWIVYWTKRMKELHDAEVMTSISEIYRRYRLTPPKDLSVPSRSDRRSRERQRSPTRLYPRERSPNRPYPPRDRSPIRQRSPGRRRSPDPRRRSPDPRRRSPDPRRRSPIPRRVEPQRPIEPRRRSPEPRRRSPEPRRRSPDLRHRSPDMHRRSQEVRRQRSPEPRRISPIKQREPPTRNLRTKSRSPLRNSSRRSPLDIIPRSDSPLSRRDHMMRNRSPRLNNRSMSPSTHTVLISDDELRPDSPHSDISLGSLPDARSPLYRASSTVSRSSRTTHGFRPATDSFDSGPVDVVSTLRLLVALEDFLGSMGPKIVDLLTDALRMEKENANSSEDLLEHSASVALMETAKEKLKGAMQAGLVNGSALPAVKNAVVKVANLLHEAEKLSKLKPKSHSTMETTPVSGVGVVNREQIAQQMAAALIAQGKTDVSAEELAQLVDAVVGMAEAKKREAAKQQPKRPAGNSGSSNALQMLQSAYNENEKSKNENDEAPDAMDGLSDSDLETLLKNFNELSAEEQHSLIAYLKKLEAKDPRRVERLRQYVSEAVTTPSKPEPEVVQEKPKVDSAPTVPEPVEVVESDDDDYTVDDVFKTAVEKVKEVEIQQGMELVKKSLEESNSAQPMLKPDIPNLNISSASNLLAMVQASLAQVESKKQNMDPVNSANQPISFGDTSNQYFNQVEPIKPLMDLAPKNVPNDPFYQDEQSQGYGDSEDQYPEENSNQPWNSGPNFNRPDNRPMPAKRGNFNQGDGNFNQARGNFNQGGDFNQGGNNFNKGGDFNKGGNFNQGGNFSQRGNFNQGGNFNRGGGNFNQGGSNFNQDGSNFNQGGNDFNQGGNNFNQGGGNNFDRDGGNNFNNGMQDRFNNQNQRFGNNPKNNQNFNANQNNFRGRGRGNRGGPRGRGRGGQRGGRM